MTGDCFRNVSAKCTYRCKDGFVYVAGDYDRYCTEFGHWNGTKLTCAKRSIVYEAQDGLVVNSYESYLLVPGNVQHTASQVTVKNPSTMEILKAELSDGEHVSIDAGECSLDVSSSTVLKVPYSCSNLTSTDVKLKINMTNHDDLNDISRFVIHFTREGRLQVVYYSSQFIS